MTPREFLREAMVVAAFLKTYELCQHRGAKHAGDCGKEILSRYFFLSHTVRLKVWIMMLQVHGSIQITYDGPITNTWWGQRNLGRCAQRLSLGWP